MNLNLRALRRIIKEEVSGMAENPSFKEAVFQRSQSLDKVRHIGIPDVNYSFEDGVLRALKTDSDGKITEWEYDEEFKRWYVTNDVVP